MLKGRKTKDAVQLFNPYNNCDYNFSKTSWEIIKIIKKHGKENAVEKIMKLFNIDKKNAEEDISTVLNNLQKQNVKLEEIPSSVSNMQYAPRTIHFDITSKCNHKCIYCYATDRLIQREELTTKQILILIDEMAELDTWTIMISGGEPFLRKDIFKILESLAKHEISTSILTNGTLITDDVAKKLFTFKNIHMIQISLDSSIPNHHDIHRGIKGIYKDTINGIQNLLKYGITPDIEIVITPINLNDIEKTIEFLHKLKIKKITIGPALTNVGRGFSNKKMIILDKDTLKSTAKKIMELKEKYKDSLDLTPTREFFAYSTNKHVSKEEIKCGVGKSILYISSEGLVYPCLFSVHPESYLGNIKKESLKEIWANSNLLKRYRDLQISDVDKCEKCDFRPIYDLLLEN